LSTLILGGGLAGLSLANFLNCKTVILEKEENCGGLCRSYDFNGVMCDVGPHILFSKNKTVNDFQLSLTETHQLRRSNRIFCKGRFVKYPFENELSALPEAERDYCLQEFLNNPYEKSTPHNMLQFFLKTFGEGITRTYLQPYNEKIWKFDPSYMDMQMVERIPKPPKEDVIKSAKGEATEGYVHQLYFNYPKAGGIQKIIDAYAERIRGKTQTVTNLEIKRVKRDKNEWLVETSKGEFRGKKLVSTIPITELAKVMEMPEEVSQRINQLRWNSIHIVLIAAKKDNIGGNFALYFADKDIIFHRLSKLNFLGQSYCLPNNGSTLMAEVTYRPGSFLGERSVDSIENDVVDGLHKLKLCQKNDVFDVQTRSFPFSYVIYDIDHRRNVDFILNYLKLADVNSVGRFAQFEYYNMDNIIEQTMALAKTLNES